MKTRLKLLGRALWLLLLAAGGPPAQAELAIIVHPNNPLTRLSPAQVAQLFLGGSVWLTPVEQSDQSPIRAEFCQKVLEKSPGQVDAIWSKIVFTARGKPPRAYHSSVAVKQAVANNLHAIGYIERAALDDSVKAIPLVP